MYEYLEGRVAQRGAARLVLAVGGVGYDLSVPVGARFGETGSETRVWTHFVVREDDQRLYGFPDRAARDLFRLVLRVRGVGPALALGLLSGLGRDRLASAIREGDAAALTAVKGVGRKTAEQILLDLRDRVDLLAPPEGVPPAALPHDAGERANIEDAVRALTSLGYSEKDARKSVDRALATVPAEDLEALVRAALGG